MRRISTSKPPRKPKPKPAAVVVRARAPKEIAKERKIKKLRERGY